MSLEPSLVNDQCLWSPRVDSCANVFGTLVWTQRNYCTGKLCNLELSLEASFSDQAYPLSVWHDLVVQVLSARTTQLACWQTRFLVSLSWFRVEVTDCFRFKLVDSRSQSSESQSTSTSGGTQSLVPRHGRQCENQQGNCCAGAVRARRKTESAEHRADRTTILLSAEKNWPSGQFWAGHRVIHSVTNTQ